MGFRMALRPDTGDIHGHAGQPAVFQDYDAFRMLSHFRVMGDHDDGAAFPVHDFFGLRCCNAGGLRISRATI